MAHVTAVFEIDDLIDALRWLRDEIAEAKSMGEWPGCLAGELVDQFRDPVRLVQAAVGVVQTDPVLEPCGAPRFTAVLAPSDALAEAFAAAKIKKAERVRSAGRSRLSWLRSTSACVEWPLPASRPGPGSENSSAGRPT